VSEEELPQGEEKPAKGKGTSAVQKRRAARMKALQALYQWDMAGGNVGSIIEYFRSSQPDMETVEHAYFEELVHGVPEKLSELDQHLQPHLDRPLDQLDPIERCVMRAGVFELAHRGVLDRLAGHLRYAETAAARRK